MRNILEYPVNEEDVERAFATALELVEKSEAELMGSLNGMVLNHIRDYFKDNPADMQKLLKSMELRQA